MLLTSRVKQDFIPNDIALGGSVPNLVLLTGANMVCLFILMLMVGWKINTLEADLRCGHHGASWLLCSC
jgi:hypothetical protein